MTTPDPQGQPYRLAGLGHVPPSTQPAPAPQPVPPPPAPNYPPPAVTPPTAILPAVAPPQHPSVAQPSTRYAPVEAKAKDPASEGNAILWLAIIGAVVGTVCCGPAGIGLMIWSLLRLRPLWSHYSQSQASPPAKLMVALGVNIVGIAVSLISMLMLTAYTLSS
jgi:hypothetical protein